MRSIRSPLDGFGSPFGTGGDPYAILGFRAPVVFDFANSYFRANNFPDTFADATEFSRASSATFMDASGVLQTAATNVARTAHHFYKDGVLKRGALFEPTAATNLVTYSSEFDNAAWAKNLITVTANVATAPDGTTTADRLTATGASAQKFVRFNSTVVGSKTFSFYAKAGTHSIIQVLEATSSLNYINIDLSDGSVGTAGANSSAVVGPDVNGYRRIKVTFANISDNSVRVYFSDSMAAGYVTSSTSTGYFDIWGAQYELGLFATSYIATTGAAATRAADVLTVPHANLPWPEIEYIGPDLGGDGGMNTPSTFASPSAFWTFSTATMDVDSTVAGKMWVGAGANQALCETDWLSSTVRRSVTFTITNSTVNFGIRIGVRDTSNGFYTGSGYVSTNGTYTVDIPAGIGIGNNYKVVIQRVGGHTGGLEVDNISVREITPLAVSIQMEGFMTGPTARLLNWSRDANTEILMDAGSSTFTFTQEAGGVVDTVAGGSFTSGINAPFNVAMTASSNLLAGAVNGVALTDNTTPVALPDLETTDLRLAFSGGPLIITEARMWAENITQAGRVEATS